MKKERFELFKSEKNAEFYWRLKAPNHEIILQSEGYKSKQGAKNGIESVKKHAPDDGNYERLDSKNSQYYFTLKAKNNEIIGVSETYKTADGRDNGIEAVKKYAPCAPIVDLTLAEEAKTVGTSESNGGLVISTSGCTNTIPVKPKQGYYGTV